MATLLTMLEIRSKAISHNRLLEVLRNEHVRIHKAKEVHVQSGKFFEFLITSDLAYAPIDPSFPEDLRGLRFLGLGHLSDQGMTLLLHQWRISSIKRDMVRLFEDDIQAILQTAAALESMERHKKALEAWTESSRGW